MVETNKPCTGAEKHNGPKAVDWERGIRRNHWHFARPWKHARFTSKRIDSDESNVHQRRVNRLDYPCLGFHNANFEVFDSLVRAYSYILLVH
jgi:hypothetical protein